MTKGVSVIIPTYNRAELICRALASIADQTRPVDEVIVVDDGSTDHTAEVVAAFDGLPCRYIRQENAGPAAARNHGLTLARFDTVAFCDSDDEWLPEKTERQLACLDAHPAVGMCFTDSGWTLDGQVREQRQNWSPRRKSFAMALDVTPGCTGVIDGRRFRRGHARIGLVCSLSTVVLRRWVIDRAGAFRDDMRLGEDYEMWLRASRVTDLYYIDESLVWTHAQSGGLTNTPELSDQFRRAWRGIWRNELRHETDPETRATVLEGLRISMEQGIWEALRDHDLACARRRLCAARAEGWMPGARTPRLLRLAAGLGPAVAVFAHRVLAMAGRDGYKPTTGRGLSGVET